MPCPPMSLRAITVTAVGQGWPWPPAPPNVPVYARSRRGDHNSRAPCVRLLKLQLEGQAGGGVRPGGSPVPGRAGREGCSLSPKAAELRVPQREDNRVTAGVAGSASDSSAVVGPSQPGFLFTCLGPLTSQSQRTRGTAPQSCNGRTGLREHLSPALGGRSLAKCVIAAGRAPRLTLSPFARKQGGWCPGLWDVPGEKSSHAP